MFKRKTDKLRNELELKQHLRPKTLELKTLYLELTSVIGIIAGVFTSASLLPQLIKIIKEKKVEELSIGMFISLMIGLLLWIYYGVLRKDLPIILTNGFSVLLNFFILFFRYKYRNNK